MLSNTLPLNSSTCCGTTPIWLRRLASAHAGDVDAVDQDAAAGGGHQPHEQVRQGALACAVGPRQRDGLAGANVQVDAVQRRRAAGVGKPDGLKVDLAAHRGQGLPLRGDGLREFGQHRAQALQRAMHLPRLPVHVRQAADGAGEQRRIQQEAHHFGRQNVRSRGCSAARGSAPCPRPPGTAPRARVPRRSAAPGCSGAGCAGSCRGSAPTPAARA